ncbi:MAG: hypothetical protein Q8K75_10360 [Chlamydiales bacterium]|nr:hypothetical protein [Chlamydiales bacterium]
MNSLALSSEKPQLRAGNNDPRLLETKKLGRLWKVILDLEQKYPHLKGIVQRLVPMNSNSAEMRSSPLAATCSDGVNTVYLWREILEQFDSSEEEIKDIEQRFLEFTEKCMNGPPRGASLSESLSLAERVALVKHCSKDLEIFSRQFDGLSLQQIYNQLSQVDPKDLVKFALAGGFDFPNELSTLKGVLLHEIEHLRLKHSHDKTDHEKIESLIRRAIERGENQIVGAIEQKLEVYNRFSYKPIAGYALMGYGTLGLLFSPFLWASTTAVAIGIPMIIEASKELGEFSKTQSEIDRFVCAGKEREADLATATSGDRDTILSTRAFFLSYLASSAAALKLSLFQEDLPPSLEYKLFKSKWKSHFSEHYDPLERLASFDNAVKMDSLVSKEAPSVLLTEEEEDPRLTQVKQQGKLWKIIIAIEDSYPSLKGLVSQIEIETPKELVPVARSTSDAKNVGSLSVREDLLEILPFLTGRDIQPLNPQEQLSVRNKFDELREHALKCLAEGSMPFSSLSTREKIAFQRCLADEVHTIVSQFDGLPLNKIFELLASKDLPELFTLYAFHLFDLPSSLPALQGELIHQMESLRLKLNVGRSQKQQIESLMACHVERGNEKQVGKIRSLEKRIQSNKITSSLGATIAAAGAALALFTSQHLLVSLAEAALGLGLIVNGRRSQVSKDLCKYVNKHGKRQADLAVVKCDNPQIVQGFRHELLTKLVLEAAFRIYPFRALFPNISPESHLERFIMNWQTDFPDQDKPEKRLAAFDKAIESLS